MSSLSLTPPPAPPAPPAVVLGPEAWVALLGEAAGVRLPSPFGTAAGPALDDADRRLALGQLRASALVPGGSGHLVRDLHPSILATLAVAGAPRVRIASAVRRGSTQDCGLLCLSEQLGAGLRRSVADDGTDRLLLGPVTLTTLVLEQAVGQVVEAFGEITDVRGRQAVRVDAAVSVAAVQALHAGREELAGVLLDGPVPEVLRSVVDGVEAVARVQVWSEQVTRVLLWLQTADGWWRTLPSGEDVVLRPVDRDAVMTDVAAALSAGLLVGSDLP